MDVEITILYVKNGVGKSDRKINLKIFKEERKRPEVGGRLAKSGSSRWYLPAS